MNNRDTIRVQFQPVGKRISVPGGTDLLEAAREAGLDLASSCGGGGNCGQCRIIVLNGRVSPLTLDEEFILSAAEQLNNERLACCTLAASDVTIQIPRQSLITGQRLQLQSELREIAIEPIVEAFQLHISPPTITDSRSDLTRIRDAVAKQFDIERIHASPEVIRQLSTAVREMDWRFSVYVRSAELIGIGPANKPPVGFAVDLGTTKIAMYLCDLQTGEELGVRGAPNPQIGYGEDVISRLNYACRDSKGGRIMAEKVKQTLNEMLTELLRESAVDKTQVVEGCIVGNTAMTHLLLNLPVTQLAKAPYVPATALPLYFPAAELGMEIAPAAHIYIPPCIGGFVGADHVSMVLASGLDDSDKISLGIDIGTNSEIAIRKPGMPFLNSVSCASGPAFEGAHIGDGMRAASGAIEKVRIGRKGVRWTTIDDAPPIGLCGSGIVDVIAELYRADLINFRGRFHMEQPLVDESRSGPQFLLVPAVHSGSNQDIAVTQNDINEIQLAKGAINAGLSILLESSATHPDEVEEVIIAGAFGSYLDIENAIMIGLFPNLPNAGYRQVGNAAAVGAKWMLLSQVARRRAEQIAAQTKYVELTAFPKFSRRFAHGMLFPQKQAPQKETK